LSRRGDQAALAACRGERGAVDCEPCDIGDDGDGAEDDADAADGDVEVDVEEAGAALMLPPPAGTLCVGRTAEGPAPAADELGVGVGVEVEPAGGLLGGAELEDPPDAGGVEGAPEGFDEPPCRVTTAPPGEKVIVLVHCPEGAALVAVAVMACDRPPPSVPEL
jgi:hypothetical protein